MKLINPKNITRKILTQQLRELERAGMIIREVHRFSRGAIILKISRTEPPSFNFLDIKGISSFHREYS